MKYHLMITNNYYMKTCLENAINMKAKHITENITLDDHTESLAQTPAFITLKDHKQNFRTSHPCHLINPSKSELGKVSKVILENVTKNLVKSLKVNQWRNMDSVINWFNTIENKCQCFLNSQTSQSFTLVYQKIFQTPQSTLQNNTQTYLMKISKLLNIVVNNFYIITMNLGKRKTQTAALM